MVLSLAEVGASYPRYQNRVQGTIINDAGRVRDRGREAERRRDGDLQRQKAHCYLRVPQVLTKQQ